ncbi:Programmed cell death protein 7, partial [Varanus komodoensis]
LVRPLRGGDPAALSRRRLERSRQKRERRWQRRQERRAAREEAAARLAEREARIDRWRARRAQEVEDRHREQELKAAADSVLSEVRKKQADTKRMAEIVRGLEKLRKLRKEAAARKGVCPPPAADEAFENEVQSLKTLIKTRTELYEAEERALRVMLEGEQEEERKREMEKKQKREKEKLLQQKREMDSKLFGDPGNFDCAVTKMNFPLPTFWNPLHNIIYKQNIQCQHSSRSGMNGIGIWCLQITLKEILSHQDGSFPVHLPVTLGPQLSDDVFTIPLKS